MIKRTLALLASLALFGCHSGRMRTTYPPNTDNFDKIEAGAKKLGWKVSRSGDEMTVFPPNQEMKIDTAPDISMGSSHFPSSVGVKCKSGSWDDCKALFNQITNAAGMGNAEYQ